MAKRGISKVAPVGKQFGRLTVISPSRPSQTSRGSSVVDCRCECGDVRAYFVSNLPKMLDPMCPDCKPMHRPAKGGTGHPLFNIWKGIIQRCENPNHTHYASYGGRGIRICEHWRQDFTAFVADMGERPSSAHTIDREDANGNYEPGNCRWAPPKVQANNRREEHHHFVEWRGERITSAEAARVAGISRELLHWRLKRGWPIEKAMTTPKRGSKPHA